MSYIWTQGRLALLSDCYGSVLKAHRGMVLQGPPDEDALPLEALNRAIALRRPQAGIDAPF